MSPARVVLDHGYRDPGHPLPGMPAPAAAVKTDQPTDPRALETIGRLVESYIAIYTEIMGRPPRLPAGHSDWANCLASRQATMAAPIRSTTIKVRQ